jgi:hypothetical protein
MRKTALTVLLATFSSGAFADWYTDENTFLLNVGANFYLEDFDAFQYGVQLNGNQTTWSAPGANGYGWDAGAAQGLWSLDGAISTSESEDESVIDFTGSPVTAFGGVFFATDDAGFIVTDTDITIALSNGTSQTITSDGLEFLGWTGETAIQDATLSVAQGSLTWIAADHVYTGTMIPEPLPLLVLGLGLVALAKRRSR